MRDTNGSRSEHHLLSCVSQMLNKANSTEITKGGNRSSPPPRRPSFFAQVSLPFFFCPLRYLSLSHSLTTSPSAIPPFLFLSLSGEEKQTAVRVRLADEFQMTLKGRGADQLSPEERPDTGARTCMKTSAQAASNKHGPLLDPHIHKRRVQLLFESILHLKSAYCQGEGSCVCASACVQSGSVGVCAHTSRTRGSVRAFAPM